MAVRRKIAIGASSRFRSKHRTLITALALVAASAAQAAPRLGFNLSGLEAGAPGALGYTHVAPARADIDLAISSGATLLRIPFKMSRVYPTIGGPADPKELAALKDAADHALANPGVMVLLDDHGFGQEYGVPYGTAPWTSQANAGQWVALLKATGYTNSDRVILGLQNEPHNAGDAWWPAVQATVTALRAARIGNFLAIDGEGYSPAYHWEINNGPQAMAIVDPMYHTFFDEHVYFDSDDSGTHAACVPGSEARIDGALADAKAHNYKIIFGEMAFGVDPSCDAVRKAVIAKIKASPNVFGVTFWTLGNFGLYPRYMFGMTGPTKATASPLLVRLLAEWNG